MWSLAVMTFTLKTILWAASLKHSEWCCLPTETNGLLDLMGWKQKMQIKHWLSVPRTAAPYMELWKCKRPPRIFSDNWPLQGSLKAFWRCVLLIISTNNAQHVSIISSGVPRNFFRGGGSTISVEDRGQRGRGSGGSSPLVRGSGGSCNLVQEISFHLVKFS